MLLSSERGIGRGESAESRIEFPFFAAITLAAVAVLVIFHFTVQNQSYTIALAVSMIVFGVTLIRVEGGIYILVVAMLLSPEISAGSVGAHGERGLNLRYDDLLIVIIFFGVLVKVAYEKRPMVWRPNPINAGIVAYYLVCVVSTLRALRLSVPAWDASVAFFVMVKMLEFYMIFFMVGLAVNSLQEVRRQLAVFFTVSMIVCGYAMATLGGGARLSAPFDSGGTEPNTLGGYLIIVVCTALGLYLYAPNRRWRITLALISVAAFFPFVMTLSRASYISLLVGVAAIGIVGRRFLPLALVGIVLILSPFAMPQDVKDRVNYTFQQGTGVPLGIGELQVDKSTYERIYVWQKVGYNLTVWPIIGGGVSWDTVLDSQYARVLIETGLLGFGAFAFLLYRLTRTTRESYRWSTDWVARGMCLGVCATTVALIVHGLGTLSFLIVRIMEPFWFLVALAVVCRDIALYNHYRAAVESTASDESGSAADMVPGLASAGLR